MSKKRTIVRSAKTALLFSTAVFFTIVFIDGILDRMVNLEYAGHVLSMDTISPGSALSWRAITQPAVVHLIYWVVVLWIFLAGLFCWLATFQCLSNCADEADAFDKGIQKGVIGLTLGMTLWLFGFIAIGGQWFAMWQSTKWNLLNDAFRMFVANGLVLSFLMLRDETQ